MEAAKLNIVVLNKVTLNTIGEKNSSSDSGGGDDSDIPSGYEEFIATDGVFSVKDGEFYVRR